MEQAEYYDRFGDQYRQLILECPEPEIWTTDYREKGPIYREMKDRVECQRNFIEKYFDSQYPVLDIGCGFGRQACLLAKMGFVVEGIDSSRSFIEIAGELFKRHQYPGRFSQTELMDLKTVGHRQVLLLDVLEHIAPNKRKAAVVSLASIMAENAKIIISIPHLRNRVSTFINNSVVKKFTCRIRHFRNSQEHPFSIPRRKKITALFFPFFEELEYLQTAKTDYFIFRRRNDHL